MYKSMEPPHIDMYFNPINVCDKYIILTRFTKKITVKEENYIEELEDYQIYLAPNEGDDWFHFINEKKTFLRTRSVSRLVKVCKKEGSESSSLLR